MGHYKSNLRDIEFNLFELLGRDEVLGIGPFAEIDSETARISDAAVIAERAEGFAIAIKGQKRAVSYEVLIVIDCERARTRPCELECHHE